MSRFQTRATSIVLAITLAWPVVAFAYINAGFRSHDEYRRYLEAKRTGRNERRQYVDEQRLRLEQQLAVINESIQRDPNDIVALYQRGKFYQEQFHDREKAMENYWRVIEQDPKFARAYYRRSFLWTGPRKDRHALSDLDEAIRLEPAFAASHFHRAVLRMNSQDPEVRSWTEARQSAEAAIELLELRAITSKPPTADAQVHAEACILLGAMAAELPDFAVATEWEIKATKFRERGDSQSSKLYQMKRTNPEEVSRLARWQNSPIQ